jgi:V8-like Glu-specific endopeptidase
VSKFSREEVRNKMLGRNGLGWKDQVVLGLEEVQSKSMFDFMQTACPETCGWCGAKGCVDEHPLCPSWARQGMCVINPFFMSHTCRESCGVCGFLAPGNKEVQEQGDKTFTDVTAGNFECGSYKALCEINNTPCNRSLSAQARSRKISKRAADLNLKQEHFCGFTMIADNWAISAAHCFEDLATGISPEPKRIHTLTLRDETSHKEVIEVKKTYSHPAYVQTKLYADIALLKLGRRVEYKFDKFGDTPECLDQGQNNTGRRVYQKAYGLTETGIKGEFLETGVTILSNTECVAILQYNVSKSVEGQRKIRKALPFGLTSSLMCGLGAYSNDIGHFRDTCKGDSGAGILTKDKTGKSTLIGVASGGVDCFNGIPGWYTRTAFYNKWIRCMIENDRILDRSIEDECIEEASENFGFR